MPFEPPEESDWFLDVRVREGRGDRVALRADEWNWSYAEVAGLAARWMMDQNSSAPCSASSRLARWW